MKPSSFLTALITALAAPASAFPTDTSLTTDVAPLNSTLAPRLPQPDPRPLPNVFCEVNQPSMLNQYKVIVRKVARPDVGPLCALLWKKLKKFEFLCLVSSPHCGYAEIVPGEPALEWKFTTASGCNGGCIGAAYWAATKNKYGAMDVSGCN